MFWTLTPSAIRSKTAMASPASPAHASTRAPPPRPVPPRGRSREAPRRLPSGRTGGPADRRSGAPRPPRPPGRPIARPPPSLQANHVEPRDDAGPQQRRIRGEDETIEAVHLQDEFGLAGRLLGDVVAGGTGAQHPAGADRARRVRVRRRVERERRRNSVATPGVEHRKRGSEP